MVGRIERVALREIWRHEAYDFTTLVKPEYRSFKRSD